MEKLPLHSNDVRRGLLKPKVVSSRRRWCEKSFYRRLPIAALLIAIWYLLCRPVSLYPSNTVTLCNTPECLKSGSSQHGTVSVSTPVALEGNKAAKMDEKHNQPKPAAENKIPLEAHIMSKCPDAQECLQDLVLPAMEQISDKVDFQLSFIARQVAFLVIGHVVPR